MNTNNLPERCPLCPNHCPMDDLHCRRGHAYFANLRGESVPEEHHRGHGGHGGHGHHPHPEIGADASLETLLMACGHRLHHRGPRGQEHILSMLAEAGGQMDQQELQEKLRIRPGSISELLSKLEEKGLVRRQRDENDRRKARILLTEDGRTKEAGKKPEPDLFASLTAEEQQTLKEILLKLLENWK